MLQILVISVFHRILKSDHTRWIIIVRTAVAEFISEPQQDRMELALTGIHTDSRFAQTAKVPPMETLITVFNRSMETGSFLVPPTIGNESRRKGRSCFFLTSCLSHCVVWAVLRTSRASTVVCGHHEFICDNGNEKFNMSSDPLIRHNVTSDLLPW